MRRSPNTTYSFCGASFFFAVLLLLMLLFPMVLSMSLSLPLPLSLPLSPRMEQDSSRAPLWFGHARAPTKPTRRRRTNPANDTAPQSIPPMQQRHKESTAATLLSVSVMPSWWWYRYYKEYNNSGQKQHPMQYFPATGGFCIRALLCWQETRNEGVAGCCPWYWYRTILDVRCYTSQYP